MKEVALIAALAVMAAPAAAQVGTPSGQAQSSAQSGVTGGAARGATGATQAPITGVFCIEEMTANFCNVVTGPNTGGYGARSGSAPTSGPGGTPSSIPPCPSEPPFNELCD